MWAAALTVQPLKLLPPNTISTTKPPPRRHSVAVQNREKLGGGGGGGANEPNHQKSVKSKTKISAASLEKEQVKEQRQLSGTDVLMALHRATTAHKAKKKDKEKRDTATTISKTRDNEATETPYFNPLCIKPEWGDRLQELETRLEELAALHSF